MRVQTFFTNASMGKGTIVPYPWVSIAIPMVVKTGPDQPVQPIEPGTGPMSGPTDSQNRWFKEPGQQPEKPVKSRKNRERVSLLINFQFLSISSLFTQFFLKICTI